MTDELENYILHHIDPEPEHLRRLNRDTHTMCLYANMCSGHLQGRLLKMLTRMIKPRHVLELGTFTGYSALCFAEGMPADAELHTIEVNDELADFISQRFDDSPYADRVHLHIGDASQIIPTIDLKWDLVFIDANKRTYKDYYEGKSRKIHHSRQHPVVRQSVRPRLSRPTDGRNHGLQRFHCLGPTSGKSHSAPTRRTDHNLQETVGRPGQPKFGKSGNDK